MADGKKKLIEAISLAVVGLIVLGAIMVHFVGQADKAVQSSRMEESATTSESNGASDPTLPPSCANQWQACTDNADMVEHYGKYLDLRIACQHEANAQARYGDPKWQSFFFGGPFQTYLRGSSYPQTGIVTAIEPDGQFQNQYGAMEHVTVKCVYDLNSDSVVSVDVQPR